MVIEEDVVGQHDRGEMGLIASMKRVISKALKKFELGKMMRFHFKDHERSEVVLHWLEDNGLYFLGVNAKAEGLPSMLGMPLIGFCFSRR